MNEPPAYLPHRRDKIITLANKRENLDYVVARREQIPSTMIAGSKVADIDLHLHYVPDRYILSPNDGISIYLNELTGENWAAPEELAQAILDDLNNELVPRWLRLQFMVGDGHGLILEDRKPNWRNEGLLSRLGLIR